MSVAARNASAPVVAHEGGAAVRGLGQSTSTPRIPHPRKALYDPNAVGRLCAACGERGRWRRWTGKNPGGWFCCSRLAREQRGDLSHTCTMACAGGVA